MREHGRAQKERRWSHPRKLAKKIRILGQVIQIDAAKIEAHLGKTLRSPLEETLNALLDAEAQHERQRQYHRLP